MKKLILITSLSLSFSFGFSQSSLLSKSIKKEVPAPALNLHQHQSQEKTIACGNDTVFYSAVKEQVVGTNNYAAIYEFSGLITEFSQAFVNTGTLTVKGISFYGAVQDAVNPLQTLSATLVLYNVNASYQPTTVLATKNVLIDTSFGMYSAMFTSPVTVTGNFAVAVKNSSPTDTLFVLDNNDSVSTYDEGLAYIKAPTFGGWLYTGSPTVFSPAAPEPIIAPIISYTINTDFTVSPNDSVCLGTPISLTNTTTDAGIVESRFFTFRNFISYWQGSPDSTYLWGMGDGTAAQWTHDVASYNYAAPGIDTVVLVTLGGFINSCVDTKTMAVTVIGNATSSYTFNATGSPTVIFTNTSTNGTSYSWDFGDGSPADTTANPTHTFPSATANYNVVLTVTNFCGPVSSTQVISISTVGLNAVNSVEGISIYPNPSNGVFEINRSANEKASLEIFNVLGERIYNTEIQNSKSLIDLSSLDAGIYSLKLMGSSSTVVKQIVLAK